MLASVSVSSKKQITLPSKIYQKLGIKMGDKLSLIYDEGTDHIILKRQDDLLESLNGRLKIPQKLKGVDIDKAINISKKKYFSNKTI